MLFCGNVKIEFVVPWNSYIPQCFLRVFIFVRYKKIKQSIENYCYYLIKKKILLRSMVGDRGMCHLSAMHKIWPLIVVDDQIIFTNNSQMALQV